MVQLGENTARSMSNVQFVMNHYTVHKYIICLVDIHFILVALSVRFKLVKIGQIYVLYVGQIMKKHLAVYLPLNLFKTTIFSVGYDEELDL